MAGAPLLLMLSVMNARERDGSRGLIAQVRAAVSTLAPHLLARPAAIAVNLVELVAQGRGGESFIGRKPRAGNVDRWGSPRSGRRSIGLSDAAGPVAQLMVSCGLCLASPIRVMRSA